MKSSKIWFSVALVLLFVVLGNAPALAQNPPTDSYRLVFLTETGQPTTVGPFEFPATSVQCGQPKATGEGTVNPTHVWWDDPANPSAADCVYVAQTGDILLALPLGTYTGRLYAHNSVDWSAGSQPSLPFIGGATRPPAPSGLRIGQPSGE